MKKLLALMLMLALMIPCALGEQQCDSMIRSAIGVLKEYWSDEVYGEFAPDISDRYLEIKNTRVVVICKEPKVGEDCQRVADEYFGDVAYIVEFMLYSDCLGAAPYYQPAGSWNSVIVHEDGTMEVPVEELFHAYRSRTYSLDIGGIVEDVIDFNQQYNAVYHL